MRSSEHAVAKSRQAIEEHGILTDKAERLKTKNSLVAKARYEMAKRAVNAQLEGAREAFNSTHPIASDLYVAALEEDKERSKATQNIENVQNRELIDTILSTIFDKYDGSVERNEFYDHLYPGAGGVAMKFLGKHLYQHLELPTTTTESGFTLAANKTINPNEGYEGATIDIQTPEIDYRVSYDFARERTSVSAFSYNKKTNEASTDVTVVDVLVIIDSNI